MISAGLPAPAFFTVRAGGASAAPYASLNLALHVGDDPSAVAANRAALATAVGAPVVFMSQTHSARVAVVASPDDVPEADATVTVTPGVALGVLVADCAPILVHCAASGVVAAIHAGRAGMAAGVVPAAIAAMTELGAEPAAMSATIGPTICGACYEVPAALRDEVAAAVPAARSETSWGTPALDIPAGVHAQLGAAGVATIRSVGMCTREDQRLFSHRRDGTTGRFAGVIVCAGPSSHGGTGAG